ncbi:MAG: hypothetical protein K2M41_04420 [Muribaculaceae bacterium]|nr:hypothetical protein [Muribaculaceae bacterium]
MLNACSAGRLTPETLIWGYADCLLCRLASLEILMQGYAKRLLCRQASPDREVMLLPSAKQTVKIAESNCNSIIKSNGFAL